MTHLAIGHIYTALHAACASAVARVVEANGVDVSYVDVSADEREEALNSHDVDILVSAWMPYDKKLAKEGREVIGELYQPQLSLFSLKNAAEENIDKALYTSIFVTAESLPYVEETKKKYPHLVDVKVENLDEGLVFERIRRASEKGENPLVLVWQPHAIFHTDILRAIPDSNVLKDHPAVAQIILRDGLRDEVDEDLLDEMSIMMLGTRVMNALDYAVSVEGQDPEEAAEAWQRGRLLPR